VNIASGPVRAAIAAGWILCVSAAGLAEDRYRPGDPFAAIDGAPIYLGELNLILTQRLKVRDLDRVDLDVKRATAALLVRRHLAMKSLRALGGDSLDRIIDREIESVASEVERRGTSLAEQAESRLADEASLKADLAWRTAWARYLKSQLNEQNLRRYFDSQRERYSGGRWQVSQIFIGMDSSDQASVSETARRMGALAEELRTADSPARAFAEAAVQSSDSPSAADGGQVGWVERDGDMPAAVMDVIRKTAPGAISQPIRSPLGMHLIYVHQAEPGNRKFEELVDDSQLRRDAADALFDALVRRQSDAKIVWFIKPLKPPASIKLVP
jgi:peptidyl-prolyl cis-trans isomerase C